MNSEKQSVRFDAEFDVMQECFCRWARETCPSGVSSREEFVLLVRTFIAGWVSGLEVRAPYSQENQERIIALLTDSRLDKCSSVNWYPDATWRWFK